MPEIPEGALRSDDGNYWWDADASAWQPVGDHAPAGAAAPGGAAPVSEPSGGGGGDGEPHITDASQLRPEHVIFARTVTADNAQILDVPPVQEEGVSES